MRVLLFGVDGLALRVLEPLIKRGDLPNFQRLRDEGVQGILRSTVPPMTPPAWMSLATGLPLASHGVYDFWDYERLETGLSAHVVTHRKGGKALWNILSDWGKRVVVANVPLTYPPEPVNGIMLSGYMAPDMQANVTFPATFKDELLREVPDYQIDLTPAVSSGQLGDPLAETLKMTQARLAMFQLLLSKPWDFCFVVFCGADRIQHLCWDRIQAFDERAVAYYQLLDRALGEAMAALGPEDLLMIVSDHGFQGTKRKFYIHEFLYRQKLLYMQNESHRLRAELLGMIKGGARAFGLRGYAQATRRRLHQFGLITAEQEHHAVRLPQLDWRRTLAWIPSSSGSIAGYADVFLSDTLSEDQIDTWIATLKALRDPATGKPVIAEIYREDVFGQGEYFPAERHLILIAHDDVMLLTDLGRQELWEPGDPASGIHHPDGILFVYGAGVKRGIAIPPVPIYDVVPTILAYMGVPVPSECCGTIMDVAFETSPHRESLQANESLVVQKLKKLASRTM